MAKLFIMAALSFVPRKGPIWIQGAGAEYSWVEAGGDLNRLVVGFGLYPFWLDEDTGGLRLVLPLAATLFLQDFFRFSGSGR
jgi:hypothetical protein